MLLLIFVFLCCLCDRPRCRDASWSVWRHPNARTRNAPGVQQYCQQPPLYDDATTTTTHTPPLHAASTTPPGLPRPSPRRPRPHASLRLPGEGNPRAIHGSGEDVQPTEHHQPFHPWLVCGMRRPQWRASLVRHIIGAAPAWSRGYLPTCLPPTTLLTCLLGRRILSIQRVRTALLSPLTFMFRSEPVIIDTGQADTNQPHTHSPFCHTTRHTHTHIHSLSSSTLITPLCPYKGCNRKTQRYHSFLEHHKSSHSSHGTKFYSPPVLVTNADILFTSFILYMTYSNL